MFYPSIPYVRFDGSMSAKRRQETIARFSVPLEDDDAPAQLLTQAHAATQSSRTTRQRRKTAHASSASDVIDLVADDDADADFVAPAHKEDDDNFIVDDSEDDQPKRKDKGRSKGKAMAKARGKRKAASKLKFDDSLADSVNPKVMLISLKAGALGLNLTVANNVYLYVLFSWLHDLPADRAFFSMDP
jgi:SWI/SNF-related matrix-associated actin-dependent regulator of chromatin subfamily A3